MQAKKVVVYLKKIIKKIIPETKISHDNDNDLYIAPEKNPLPVDDVVSVVIPTYNAGTEFSTLLRLLAEQKGVPKVEIIIVDSESIDNTIKTAKELGAKIIHIKHSAFSHSFARNIGAENASGKYVLFMTQDAKPSRENWIQNMLQPIIQKQAIAVSCREEPREDCDLYGKFSIWQHSKYMNILVHDRILKMPNNKEYNNLRKNGQLNNVACVMPRDIFLAFRYRGDFAEDLDLGIRLIKSGYQLALLSSNTVIHSHNRPASYYLKRFFVDTITLKKTFTNFSVENKSAENCMNQSIVLYAGTKLYVKELVLKLDQQTDSRKFFKWTDKYYSKIIYYLKKQNYEYFDLLLKEKTKYDDDVLNSYINNLYFNVKNEFIPDTSYLSIQQHLLTKVIPEYFAYTNEPFTKHTKEMVGEMMFKNVGELCGKALASYVVFHENEDSVLNKYTKELREGV